MTAEMDAPIRRRTADPARIHILGIPVSVIDCACTVPLVIEWAAGSRARTVFVREVASLMAAVNERRLADLHDQADLVIADGMPLVWVARLRGCGTEIGRIAGADLVDAVCNQSLKTGQSHFFFGGKPGVADMMAKRLSERHQGLAVAGTYSPPMRSIGPDYELDREALSEIEQIRNSGADFIWVGISSPKQEYWMMKAAPLLGRGVFFGVGAAFDFHSGAVKRAPIWMRNRGLEWAHRLMSEPVRLWRRYLLLGPKFVAGVILEEAMRRRHSQTRKGHRS